MKNLFKMSFLCIIALLIVGCSKNDDSEDFDLSSLVGDWVGTFSGDDTGNFRVYIYENGTVTGNAYSNGLQQGIPLNGQIDESGKFDAVLGSSENGASFTGKFTENASSGTWENPSINTSGTWVGSKE
tara:strand:- start:1255 stop:1638 length:384 start_codon:yes stop_codon:yes gene_type:complete